MQTADRSRLFHPQMALTESDFAIYLDLKQECGQNYIHDWAISSMKINSVFDFLSFLPHKNGVTRLPLAIPASVMCISLKDWVEFSLWEVA